MNDVNGDYRTGYILAPAIDLQNLLRGTQTNWNDHYTDMLPEIKTDSITGIIV
jgi:hypothetical protein